MRKERTSIASSHVIDTHVKNCFKENCDPIFFYLVYHVIFTYADFCAHITNYISGNKHVRYYFYMILINTRFLLFDVFFREVLNCEFITVLALPINSKLDILFLFNFEFLLRLLT